MRRFGRQRLRIPVWRPHEERRRRNRRIRRLLVRLSVARVARIVRVSRSTVIRVGKQAG